MGRKISVKKGKEGKGSGEAGKTFGQDNDKKGQRVEKAIPSANSQIENNTFG